MEGDSVIDTVALNVCLVYLCFMYIVWDKLPMCHI